MNKWSKGEWCVGIQAWYDYPNNNPTGGTGDNFIEFEIEGDENTPILNNWFKIWALNPDELKEYNEVFWGLLCKHIQSIVVNDYTYLANVKCEDCIIEISPPEDDLWPEVWEWWLSEKLGCLEFIAHVP